jgi:hypothetical protein
MKDWRKNKKGTGKEGGKERDNVHLSVIVKCA